MPVLEVRETIQGTVTTNEVGFGYMTRRINVPEGMRNELLNLDMYNDNVDMLSYYEAPLTGITGYQLFLSPYPVQITNESIAMSRSTVLANAGPMAGQNTILYKETKLTNIATIQDEDTVSIFGNQYPSSQSAAVPTNKFYSAHVYLTIFVWNQELADIDVKFSMFMKVRQTKVNPTQSSMGRYAEFLDAQCRLLTSTAVSYDPAKVAGYTFPMWKVGGIRPEIMISSTNALRYYNRVASNADQEMVSQGDLFGAYKNATTMSAFDSAFGDPALNLPAWITLMDVAGITSGVLRPYPPPLKYADNGNTLMF